MNNYNNFDNNNTMSGFQFMSLTPEEEEDNYNYLPEDEYESNEICNWIDDCECQENLATILPLNPEECIIDENNQIQSIDGVKLFFEELGYLTEEPEPIDPTRDYEAEAQALIEQRNKTRKMHIELSSPIPSLDDNDTQTSSGISSTSSSYHQVDTTNNYYNNNFNNGGDIRSHIYGGGCGQQTHESYSYAPHANRSFCK